MDIEQLYQLYLAHPDVTTDSRTCPTGSLFFALHGPHFDGNDYALSALEKGCAYAVVDREELAAQDARCICVADTLHTLQRLAQHHRRALALPVLAITGTNGKTTTKELTAAVLGTTFRVLYTQGNLNNAIGVPLTLLRLRPEHEIAVIEMGASHPGDIQELVNICEPTYGLITNVGRAHLQGFGSITNVTKTKGELYDYLRLHGGLVFVNANDSRLAKMSAGLRRCPYGLTSNAMTDCNPLLQLKIEDRLVQTQLIGAYNTPNVLAAAAVGKFFDVSLECICKAIEGYAPSNQRSQLIRTPHNLLILDAYNANPTSMAAAIEAFHQMKAIHKLCILADMKELGKASQSEHRRVCKTLRHLRLQAFLVGEEFGKADPEKHFSHFDSTEQLTSHLKAQPITDATILIKGSNSMRLSSLTSCL